MQLWNRADRTNNFTRKVYIYRGYILLIFSNFEFKWPVLLPDNAAIVLHIAVVYVNPNLKIV